MGQRTRILTQITGFGGWNVVSTGWETGHRQPLEPVAGYDVLSDAVLVLVMARRWAPRCAHCLAIARAGSCHEHCRVRRWADLPWAGHRVVIEYAPIRVKCRRCGSHSVELLAWAEPKQRQTRRLQQHLALDAFSMPLVHVATKYGLSWHTVRRAEVCAIARWDSMRPPEVVQQVGVDEKWLGRRHRRPEKFVTIVSNLETGTPIWIGYGRGADTLASWLRSLTPEQKLTIKLFAMDMHAPFRKAIEDDPGLKHAAIAHDPFHIMKRAGEAISELRRQIFFRAGATMRAVGRGTRWLVLKAWEKTSEEERATLRRLLSCNARLARAYQVVEELRCALRAHDVSDMGDGIWHVLCRTRRRDNVPMRKLHDSLIDHMDGIIALGEHHPPTGRIEALNNNWETLVRRGRGYRDHQYLLAKLRFVTANPVRNADGVQRFVALGLPTPHAPKVAA
jgi:transposase